MSLHKFAEQVAAHGRGDDSLLVHMTPDEVQRLQKFAEANGRSLTINPHTGLPEAGFLSDLFKAVAPIALGAFLGPAGFGLSATMAGVATGGITALATGSLSRGLMAGLGAYGGAGLGEGLMTAGGGMSAANAASAAQGQLGAANLALGEAMPTQVADQFTKDAVARMTPSGAVSAGLDKALANPLEFAKDNYKPLLAAAAPIAAGAMVPTTTQLPTAKDNNYIRQFDLNINPETGKPDLLYGIRAMTPVKANEWNDKTFQGQREVFRQQNPNPYELGVASLNRPPQQQTQPTTPMATGGIVALADGGDAALEAYKAGNYGEASRLLADAGMNAQDVVSKYGLSQADAAAVAQNLGYKGDMSGLQYTAPPAAAAPTYTQYTPEQIGSYLTANPNADINKAITATNADPAAVNKYIASLTSPFVGSTDTTGGSGTLGIYNQMVAKGVDPNEYYAAALANDPKYAGWTKDMLQKGYNLDKGAYALTDQIAKDKTAADATLGYDKQWAKFMDDNNYSIDDMAQAFGLSRNEVKARYDAAKAASKVVTPITKVVNTGTNTGLNTNVVPGSDYGSGPATGVDSLGRTVSIATPGDIVTNSDGTRTVVPNIPGRPYGGFTGIDAIKSAYTAGGGSLGYTAKAPRTIAEFDQLYNKQTGDSLAAYDYLMGKGSGKYPAKSGVSQLSVPYAEYALGKKTTALKKPTTTTVQGMVGQPQTYFDEAAYLAANPDVAAALKSGKSNFTNAYQHYLMYGKQEGRPFTGDYQGYTTAMALANAAGAGGGSGGYGGPGGSSVTGSLGNTVANEGVPVSDMGSMSPAAAAAAAAASAAAAAGDSSGNTGGGPGTGASGDAAFAYGGLMPRGYAIGGGLGSLGSYSDGGRLLKGPGDGVSDSIPATIGAKQQPARLADGEFVVPARIVSELGNGSTEAGAKKLYAMMDRVQKARGKTTGKNKVAANSRADKYLPA